MTSYHNPALTSFIFMISMFYISNVWRYLSLHIRKVVLVSLSAATVGVLSGGGVDPGDRPSHGARGAAGHAVSRQGV